MMMRTPGTRISPIGAYNPVVSRPPAYPSVPSVPCPPAPTLPPALPPVQTTYPSYPSYPSYPTQPSYPSYPIQNQYPSYPSVPGQHNAVGDFFHGAVDRVQELAQYVLHPFDASKRRMPYHNPYQPRTGAEEAGRWLVNGALIVGAFLVGKQFLGGGVGGWARVGSSNGILYSLGSALNTVGRAVGSVITAPFKLLGRVFSLGAHVGVG